MSLASRKLIQATAGAADTGDNDFANVVLLLDGDGTNGDANNTFTDSSPNGFTVTESGSVVQGSFSPYGDNWSNYFDGSGDYLSLADTATLQMGNGDFTIEAWIYINTHKNYNYIYSYSYPYQLLVDSNGNLESFFNDADNSVSYISVQGSSVIPTGAWTHVAVVRNGSSFKQYVNGVEDGSTTSSVTLGVPSTYDPTIGNWGGTGYAMNGYISNARIVKGTAVYTSAFTPPTEPLTAISGTSLLTCQSNRFVDESTNNHTVTVNGTPKVTPFSPFRNDEARDITVDGGSGYFAGSGDYLEITDNNDLDFGTGDLTVEFWAYFDEGISNANGIISKGSASTGWQIIFSDTDKLKFIRTTGSANSPQITSSTSSTAKCQWHHIALTRSGTTVTLWINGVSEGTYTDSTSWDTSDPLRIGTNRGANSDYVGYISDVRIFKGLAVYTAAFDPPTEPLGNLAGSANALTYGVYSGKSFSVASEELAPQGVRFKSDGTKMYVVGNTGDDVGQYSLSTAWDVSTASFDSVILDVSSEDTIPTGLAFSSDGTKLYISGNSNIEIFQYDLSTAWDLSTASYASKSLSPSTGAGSGTRSPFMRSNGTDFYFIGQPADTVYQYTLSTANDISTASYASKSFDVSSQEATPTGLTFSSDGTKMFVCGNAGDDINQYTLSTAWDVSTASFDSVTLSVSSESNNPSGIDLKPDGSVLYMISSTGDAVYQYSLTDIPPQVLLNFQDAGIYDLTGINNVDTEGNAQIDTAVKKYGTGSMEFDETGDYLAVPPTDDIILGTGDFTIEGWLYIGTNPVGNGQGMFQISNGYLNSAVRGPAAGVNNGNGKWAIYYGTSQQTATAAAPSINTWYHVAYVRNSSTTKLYIDGTELISVSDSTNYSDTYLTIGGWYSASYLLNGFIDDFRITKGIARYTSSFTPPTAALPKF